MELLLLIFILGIFGETSFLTFRNLQKSSAGHSGRRKVYVDTSALMDPRLPAVARTGFIGDDILISRGVTHELQLLADGKDSDKRTRARAGLETVRELERVVHFNTSLIDDGLGNMPVDDRLIELARSNRGLILTNDYNLQKLAETEHIEVLNLNELALSLRAKYLPGEHAKVRIVALGSNPHQGVAYLDDGTMVVVDNASRKQGQELEVEFLRINQTPSGVMMFAKIINPSKRSYLPKERHKRRS